METTTEYATGQLSEVKDAKEKIDQNELETSEHDIIKEKVEQESTSVPVKQTVGLDEVST